MSVRLDVIIKQYLQVMSLMELGGNSVDGPYSRFQCFKPAEPHSPLFPGLYFPSNCLTPEN